MAETTNLPAFQILLAKLRLASTFSTARLVSFPGEDPTSKVKRKASVPRSSITVSGSITLP